MKEIIVKEKRTDIFIGLVGLLVITPLIVGFTIMLLKDANLFAHNNHIPFIILVSLFIIASKDSITMLIILCIKLISPYYIKFDQQGFYDCRLRQYVKWEKIDRFEYVNYKTTFFNKRDFWEYFLYMILLRNSTGILYDLFKTFILSKIGITKKLVIITKNKDELLSKASFIKKTESKLLPKNVININIEPSSATQDDIISVIKALHVYNKTL